MNIYVNEYKEIILMVIVIRLFRMVFFYNFWNRLSYGGFFFLIVVYYIVFNNF